MKSGDNCYKCWIWIMFLRFTKAHFLGKTNTIVNVNNILFNILKKKNQEASMVWFSEWKVIIERSSDSHQTKFRIWNIVIKIHATTYSKIHDFYYFNFNPEIKGNSKILEFWNHIILMWHTWKKDNLFCTFNRLIGKFFSLHKIQILANFFFWNSCDSCFRSRILAINPKVYIL